MPFSLGLNGTEKLPTPKQMKTISKRSPAGVRLVNFLLGMYPLPLLYGQL